MLKTILYLSLINTLLFSQINWNDSYNSALKKARELKKPLFIFMERKNPPCRWCQKMEKETLNDEKISQIINKNFIPIKIAKEKKDYPSFLDSKYVPTIFILDYKQKPITKIVGYWGINDFESDLNYILKKIKKDKSF